MSFRPGREKKIRSWWVSSDHGGGADFRRVTLGTRNDSRVFSFVATGEVHYTDGDVCDGQLVYLGLAPFIFIHHNTLLEKI